MNIATYTDKLFRYTGAAVVPGFGKDYIGQAALFKVPNSSRIDAIRLVRGIVANAIIFADDELETEAAMLLNAMTEQWG